MTCDMMQSRLTALADGELTPETAAEVRRHLAACPGCAQAQAEWTAVREMAVAWNLDAPDITERVMSAVAADDQRLLLEEMQRLRAEMQELRAEVAALRRQLPPQSDAPLWSPPTHLGYSRIVYSRMENDPWNLTRS